MKFFILSILFALGLQASTYNLSTDTLPNGWCKGGSNPRWSRSNNAHICSGYIEIKGNYTITANKDMVLVSKTGDVNNIGISIQNATLGSQTAGIGLITEGYPIHLDNTKLYGSINTGKSDKTHNQTLVSLYKSKLRGSVLTAGTMTSSDDDIEGCLQISRHKAGNRFELYRNTTPFKGIVFLPHGLGAKLTRFQMDSGKIHAGTMILEDQSRIGSTTSPVYMEISEQIKIINSDIYGKIENISTSQPSVLSGDISRYHEISVSDSFPQGFECPTIKQAKESDFCYIEKYRKPNGELIDSNVKKIGRTTTELHIYAKQNTSNKAKIENIAIKRKFNNAVASYVTETAKIGKRSISGNTLSLSNAQFKNLFINTTDATDGDQTEYSSNTLSMRARQNKIETGDVVLFAFDVNFHQETLATNDNDYTIDYTTNNDGTKVVNTNIPISSCTNDNNNNIARLEATGDLILTDKVLPNGDQNIGQSSDIWTKIAGTQMRLNVKKRASSNATSMTLKRLTLVDVLDANKVLWSQPYNLSIAMDNIGTEVAPSLPLALTEKAYRNLRFLIDFTQIDNNGIEQAGKAESNNFAIRPERFSLELSPKCSKNLNEEVTDECKPLDVILAGAPVYFHFKALDAQGRPTKGYDKFPSFINSPLLEMANSDQIKDNYCHIGSSMWKINQYGDGEAKGEMRYYEIGEIRLKIKESQGKLSDRWAYVDCDDAYNPGNCQGGSNDTNKITEAITDIKKFIPYYIEATNISLMSYQNPNYAFIDGSTAPHNYAQVLLRYLPKPQMVNNDIDAEIMNFYGKKTVDNSYINCYPENIDVNVAFSPELNDHNDMNITVKWQKPDGTYERDSKEFNGKGFLLKKYTKDNFNENILNVLDNDPDINKIGGTNTSDSQAYPFRHYFSLDTRDGIRARKAKNPIRALCYSSDGMYSYKANHEQKIIISITMPEQETAIEKYTKPVVSGSQSAIPAHNNESNAEGKMFFYFGRINPTDSYDIDNEPSKLYHEVYCQESECNEVPLESSNFCAPIEKPKLKSVNSTNWYVLEPGRIPSPDYKSQIKPTYNGREILNIDKIEFPAEVLYDSNGAPYRKIIYELPRRILKGTIRIGHDIVSSGTQIGFEPYLYYHPNAKQNITPVTTFYISRPSKADQKDDVVQTTPVKNFSGASRVGN